MGRLFGTDGVRGVANLDLTAELALELSAAAAHLLVARAVRGAARPVAVVGRDTRASGEFLEAAVVAGLSSAGVDVRRLGVVPTPGIAYLTRALSAQLGVVLSASHNPMPDNGIKFFDSDGYKLADSAEDAIEASCGKPRARPTGADVGRVCDDSGAVEAYLDYLLKQLPHSLQGLHVVVDCANGAASTLAPELFRRAGATVHAVSAEPTGLNINDGCGSTQPGGLAAEVVGRGADAGIALDGDADRCIAVDASGEIVDGDAILAICALRLQESGLLSGDTVVTTVMTNLGFCQAMQRAGIAVVQTPVGDRYVLEEMRRRGAALGGEQSGHLIFLHQATTGDGLLTALHLLVRMAATSKSLRELAAVMRRLPQVLVNVPTADRERVLAAPAVAAAVRRAEQRLAGAGRVLVRPSGTEPVVRVMVEAPSEAEAAAVAADVAAAFPG